MVESEIIQEFIKLGIAGLVAALFIWIAFDRDKKLMASLLARIADNDAIKGIINTVNLTLTSMQIAIDNRAAMTMKIEETMRGVATAQVQHATALEGLRKSMEQGDKEFVIHIERFDRLQDTVVDNNRRMEEALPKIEELVRSGKGSAT